MFENLLLDLILLEQSNMLKVNVKIVKYWPNSRGRYFAERAEFCLGHFWGAPGQNFSSLEKNQKIL